MFWQMEVICANGKREFRNEIYQSSHLLKLIYPNGEPDRFAYIYVKWVKQPGHRSLK